MAPLLGSLAISFELVEDPIALARMQVSVAAVDPEAKEIYVDGRRLDEASCRFVLAHEMFHVGLRHGARRQGRDPFLWNVACDYVINGWLVEMGLGELPEFGGLFDPSPKGLSAEALYDRIVADLRRYRKVATLRGAGLGDLLEGGGGEQVGTDLDAVEPLPDERGAVLGLAEEIGGGVDRMYREMISAGGCPGCGSLRYQAGRRSTAGPRARGGPHGSRGEVGGQLA